MAGTLVVYTRFVEAQQRRARVVAQLMQPLLRDTTTDLNADSVVEERPIEIVESRREFHSTEIENRTGASLIDRSQSGIN